MLSSCCGSVERTVECPSAVGKTRYFLTNPISLDRNKFDRISFHTCCCRVCRRLMSEIFRRNCRGISIFSFRCVYAVYQSLWRSHWLSERGAYSARTPIDLFGNGSDRDRYLLFFVFRFRLSMLGGRPPRRD